MIEEVVIVIVVNEGKVDKREILIDGKGSFVIDDEDGSFIGVVDVLSFFR